jgi:hypothetical protein
MKTSIVFLCMALCSAAGASCPSDQTAEEEALQSLYSDNELVNYVCGPGTRCSDAEFSSRLDVLQVSISSSTTIPDGLSVSPKTKGTLFFTGLFLRDGCRYKNVLYPDLSSSGLKITRRIHDGKYVVTSTDRDSRSEWSETDYIFDRAKGTYIVEKTQCFAAIAGKTISKACE